jgi:hypothetical protein
MRSPARILIAMLRACPAGQTSNRLLDSDRTRNPPITLGA